ncbi:AAA family ATPase [Ignavibacteria bacterium CHB1]|nr:MAG: AAA family ATPase [Chlorobiota bacterium]MBV6398495.1 Chaperone protein ClpB 1 [Ignavibacteria bacterium]MCC6885729.1 AAA family ATPase [Ignavibacteriales bacterium]MCE7953076.1 AAA family ATPase [Chlorobi bacterium CHB7]MDL1887086.1 AAA family ATPase [Ignavibacteria bacterium CHB1]RIK49893.1 MAG: chaperone protein ClpB [Ignavibacteriota bacterium]
MADKTVNPTKKRLEEIEKELADLQSLKKELVAHWNLEKDLIKTIRASKEEIEDLKAEAEQLERQGDLTKVAEIRYGKIPGLEKQISDKTEELSKVQSDKKMLKEEVDSEDIAEIVSRWTGIPVSKMLEGERQKLLNMEKNLEQRVVGQDDAVTAVSNAIRRSRAGLQDESRPIGSFIFLGTTGVGKTELARALAEFLFDDEKAIVRIDMSEYMEKFAVSRLIGAPPGYVGYEEGGQLTEAVRRKPYCVVLLDEIEKAHPDVFNILLQVLDEGRLTDSKGKTVNFKNTIIIMTSNIGSHLIQEKMDILTDVNRDEVMGELKVKLFDLLKSSIRPEFLNRIDEIILFKPLTQKEIRLIVDLQLTNLFRRLEHNQITMTVDNEVKDWLGKLGFDVAFGARPLKRIVQKHLINKLSEKILAAEILPGDKINAVLNVNGEIDFVKVGTKSPS